VKQSTSQLEKAKKDAAANPERVGKSTEEMNLKELRRANKDYIVKLPKNQTRKHLKKKFGERQASRTRVSDFRHADSNELKGLGWAGPPIKREKKQGQGGKDNVDLPAAQQLSLFAKGMGEEDSDEEGGLAAVLSGEEQAGALSTEDTAMFVFKSSPIFMVLQCSLVFFPYIVNYFSNGDPLAGLESYLRDQTDLALTDQQCADYRLEVWRWWTYQFSHNSLEHMGKNVLVVLLLGVPLEGFHGHWRAFLMFTIGVLGGAGCMVVFDPHSRVVGMSGGVYSLFGIHLADTYLNPERTGSGYKWKGMVLVICIEIILNLLSTQSETSFSAHFGGAFFGLLAGYRFGNNLRLEDHEERIQLIALLLMIGVGAFCAGWSQMWAPMSITEQVPWCWAAQVNNETIFGDGEWHCVRCDNPDCIAEFSAPEQTDSLAATAAQCLNDLGGWAITKR